MPTYLARNGDSQGTEDVPKWKFGNEGNPQKRLACRPAYAILKCMVTMTEAYDRLTRLSQERAQRVLSLIEDLAELEALENADDLVAARRILANPESVPWQTLRSELDELHR